MSSTLITCLLVTTLFEGLGFEPSIGYWLAYYGSRGLVSLLDANLLCFGAFIS